MKHLLSPDKFHSESAQFQKDKLTIDVVTAQYVNNQFKKQLDKVLTDKLKAFITGHI